MRKSMNWCILCILIDIAASGGKRICARNHHRWHFNFRMENMRITVSDET